MILVDHDLRRLLENGDFRIVSTNPDHPFDPDVQIGPGSVDLRLGPVVRRYVGSAAEYTAPVPETETVTLDPNNPFTIQPGEFWLANTLETVMVPPALCGMLTGRSSIARLGLLVDCSQSFIQPGYSDPLPLQLVNITRRPITILPQMKICQLVIITVSSGAAAPYYSRPEAKYRTPSAMPEPSRIGIELGFETPGLAMSSDAAPLWLQDEVAKWRVDVERLESHENSLFERIRRVEEQIVNPPISNGTEIATYVSLFAGPPLVDDTQSRSSFRDDTVITKLKTALLEFPSQDVRILDACCGHGSWVKFAPSALGTLVSRLRYVGVDTNPENIRQLETAARSFRSHFGSFQCATRDVSDLDGLGDAPFDFIFFHNTLHEICPSNFAAILKAFASRLRPESGTLSLIDMETLPDETPEGNAIMWTGTEASGLIAAAGFRGIKSTHTKSVSVFSIDAHPPTISVDESRVDTYLIEQLRRKLRATVDDRNRCPQDPTKTPSDLKRWLLLCAAIARQAEAILALEDRLIHRGAR